MLGYQQAISIGMGQRPDPDLFAAREDLTWRERRRAGQCVQRGEAAWDEPSARFAAASARTVMRQPMLYGKRGTQIAMSLITLLFVVQAAVSISDGAVLPSIFYCGFGVFFIYIAIRFPRLVRNAPRAYERNIALLGGTLRVDHAAATPTRAEVWGSRAFAAVVMGGLFSVFSAILDPSDLTVGRVVAQSVFFGVFMVVFGQWAARRQERKEAKTMPPSEPAQPAT